VTERGVQRSGAMTLSGNTIRTAPAERLRVDAVLLDIDGTLVDSNDAHAKAWKDALDENGIEARFPELRRLIGMGGELLLEEVSGIAPASSRSKTIRDRRDVIFRERYLDEVRPQPGAHALIEKLRARGFKLVAATSSAEENVRPLLTIAGSAELETVSGDEVELAKPEPDVVRAALRKAGVNADRAVLIGDTPYDVAAGRKAGVAVIALRCGGWNDDALDGAIEVFDDPEDILKNWMQTPFRKSLADLDAPL